MEKEWIKVFRTRQLFEANVVEALLKDNDIAAHIMNKQDSSYGLLLPGEIEIYTLAENEQEAKDLIKKGLEQIEDL